MRALITGGAGFVGEHLGYLLDRDGDEVYIYDTVGDDDVRDYDRLRNRIEHERPDMIFHLAAQPSPAESWIDPDRGLEISVTGTLNLLEACRALDWQGRILLVGSEAEYGLTMQLEEVTELSLCQPTTPYGIAKLAATHLGLAYAARYGLHVVVARPSYHTGPGQHPRYAVSAFARQVAEVESHHRQFVEHGNLSGTRHLLDVRDVVRAYRLIIDEPPGIFNVSGGTAITMAQVLRTLTAFCDITIPTKQRPMPPSSEPTIMQPPTWERLASLGWSPRIAIEITLLDLLQYWRDQL